jgi:hypothetical protein
MNVKKRKKFIELPEAVSHIGQDPTQRQTEVSIKFRGTEMKRNVLHFMALRTGGQGLQTLTLGFLFCGYIKCRVHEVKIHNRKQRRFELVR